jgi:5-methylcytosine-specific restriction endonuclease McrA
MTTGKAERKLVDGVPEELKQKIVDFLDQPHIAEPEVIISYEARNRYGRYLRSKEWLHIRRRVLKRDQRQCWRCGGQATLVHHRSYAPEVLAGNNDEQLASLCEGCHTVVHYEDSGAERPWHETERILLEKCHVADFPTPKVDLRRRWPNFPPEWPRMTAVQRSAWQQEHSRIKFARLMEKAKKQTSSSGAAR